MSHGSHKENNNAAAPTLPLFHHIIMIFATKALEGSKKPNSLFSNRGITDLETGPASSANLRGIPKKNQIAYGSYKQFIHFFMKATVEGKSLRVSETEGAFFIIQRDDLIPLASPPLAVAEAKGEKIKDDVWLELEKDFGGKRQRMGGSNAMVFDETSKGLLARLGKLPVNPALAVSGFVTNLNGIIALSTALKIITAFVTTNSK